MRDSASGVTVVIPARFGSSRFPGKPLVPLCGRPMIQHVYERALASVGVERVVVATDDQRIADAVTAFEGEVIVKAVPDVGYLHRGTEKLAEVRSYHHCVVLTDRWDYVAAMPNNLVFCLAAEKLLGVKAPPRADALRVIMCEMNRVASHLLFFGTYGIDIGAFTPFLYAFREREMVLDLFEMLCGARLTYNYIRLGGVMKDVDEKWVGKCREFLEFFAIKDLSSLPTLREFQELSEEHQVIVEKEAPPKIEDTVAALADPMARARMQRFLELGGQTADQVVAASLAALKRGSVVVPSGWQARLIWWVSRVVPRRLLVRQTARRMKPRG